MPTHYMNTSRGLCIFLQCRYLYIRTNQQKKHFIVKTTLTDINISKSSRTFPFNPTQQQKGESSIARTPTMEGMKSNSTIDSHGFKTFRLTMSHY